MCIGMYDICLICFSTGYIHRESVVSAGAASAGGPSEWRRGTRTVGKPFVGTPVCY